MDLAVVRGGCEEDAVLRVGPRDAPNGAFVAVVLVSTEYTARADRMPQVLFDIPLQCLLQSMLVAVYFEYLDGLVGGACCETAAIVIQDGIVLGKVSSPGFRSLHMSGNPYNHVLMARVRNDLCLITAISALTMMSP